MIKKLVMVGIVLAVGCNTHRESDSSRGGDVTTPMASAYLAESEPEGAVPVGEARQATKDDESVTLVGLIGGSTEPFVDGLAAFTIVDPKVPYCPPEEGCPTPWDYCCQTDAVKENIATIKVVDPSGNLVVGDARELLNVKELSTVVVEGKASRDENGNLTVAASKVFVRPAE